MRLQSISVHDEVFPATNSLVRMKLNCSIQHTVPLSAKAKYRCTTKYKTYDYVRDDFQFCHRSFLCGAYLDEQRCALMIYAPHNYLPKAILVDTSSIERKSSVKYTKALGTKEYCNKKTEPSVRSGYPMFLDNNQAHATNYSSTTDSPYPTSHLRRHLYIHFQRLYLYPSQYFCHLSVIWIKADHEVITPGSNANLTTSRSRTFIPFALTKRTCQVLEGERADTLRELGRARCVGKEAKNGGNLTPVRTWTGSRLPRPPSRLRDRHAGHLGNKIAAGTGGVALDGRADTVSAALFAGVRGGVAGDLANVGEAPYISFGRTAGSELLRAIRR